VKWRAGATTKDKKRCLALAYMDARDVFNRLDQVCGPDGWQSQVMLGPEGRATAGIGVRIERDDEVGFEWLWRWDGAGATAVEGEKGGISDAIKRAAVQFGIGRYLYNVDSPWVEYDQVKKKITEAGMHACVAALGGSTAMSGKGVRGASDPRPVPSTAREGDQERLATKEEKKVLFKWNFRAVEKVFQVEVDAMEKKDKFAALDYAVSMLGKKNDAQIRIGEMDEVKKHIQAWVAADGKPLGKPGGATDEQF
jgi:hypothetical protein